MNKAYEVKAINLLNGKVELVAVYFDEATATEVANVEQYRARANNIRTVEYYVEKIYA